MSNLIPFKEFLTEIFDNPAKYKWVVKDKVQWKAKFNLENVTFYGEIYAFNRDGLRSWEILFRRIINPGKTGTYDMINDDKFQFKVFATMKSIVYEFLKKKKVASFVFGAKEKSRRKLYDTFAKMIEKDVKYKLTHKVEELNKEGEPTMYYYFRQIGK